jgi:ketosteroid isomerase-like protein
MLLAAALCLVASALSVCTSARKEGGMAGTDSDEQVRREILEIEREIMAAIERKDGEALGRALAEEFVYRTPKGEELSREAFLKNITSIPFEILSVRGEGLKVDVFGETAVLTGVQVATARTGEGKEETGRGAFTDVFVRRGGRWLMALAYDVELPAADVTPEKEAAK